MSNKRKIPTALKAKMSREASQGKEERAESRSVKGAKEADKKDASSS